MSTREVIGWVCAGLLGTGLLTALGWALYCLVISAMDGDEGAQFILFSIGLFLLICGAGWGLS